MKKGGRPVLLTVYLIVLMGWASYLPATAAPEANAPVPSAVHAGSSAGATSSVDLYFKIDQGFAFGRLLDQKMSNLHYAGIGGVLNFGRRAEHHRYTAEWHFARIQFLLPSPDHGATSIQNPSYGLRYMHLRKLDTAFQRWQLKVGGQADVFTNLRWAPRLGNSFLFIDFVGVVRPRADASLRFELFRRSWNLDMHAAFSLGGYALRMPEYGVSYQLSDDGGVRVQGHESQWLHPFNYWHGTTGLLYRGAFGGEDNPNWYRIGYIWDYYSLGGRHGLNVNHATHQFVLELYFKVN